MAPSAITSLDPPSDIAGRKNNILDGIHNAKASTPTRSQYLLDRSLHKDYATVVGGKGNWLFTQDGRRVFDASGGAAVSCLGHGDDRVIEAVYQTMKNGTPYLASSMWANSTVDDLCQEIIDSTDGKMARVYLCSSGSEAMEASIKLSRQYFYEKDKNTKRVNFIAREGSYHGNTIGALAISGHMGRRAPYLSFLMPSVHHVSSCNPYRQRLPGQTDASFVARKAEELERKFQELGPDTVIAFVAEPVVGAALGCVPAVPGYLKAMQEVCHRHGALLILDEVMCGMGRLGTFHAWQQEPEDVVPDIQTVGKGLGGGYQPIAAVLVEKKVVQALMDGTGQFVHGQTYQGMPVQAAAALEVQRIVRKDNLMANVTAVGAYLGKRLSALLDHPNVGDVRGKGLFWGLEFVQDKQFKKPFEANAGVAWGLHNLAIAAPFNMTVYPGIGTADGKNGDHIMICPTYNVTEADIDFIVDTLEKVVKQFFTEPNADS